MPKQSFEVSIEFIGGTFDAKEYKSRAEAIAAYEAAKRRWAVKYVAMYKNGSLVASYGAAL